MPQVVDFVNVSTAGLETSPVTDALAGLRANEARYYKNKFDHDFTVAPASEAAEAVDYVHRILQEERDLGDGLRLTHWKQSIPIASCPRTPTASSTRAAERSETPRSRELPPFRTATFIGASAWAPRRRRARRPPPAPAPPGVHR